MTREQVIRAVSRAIQRVREDLGELEKILASELAGAYVDEDVVTRMCRSKRAYSSAESAGASAASRGGGLRVYECPLCKAFHLTSRALDAFAGVE